MVQIQILHAFLVGKESLPDRWNHMKVALVEWKDINVLHALNFHFKATHELDQSADGAPFDFKGIRDPRNSQGAF